MREPTNLSPLSSQQWRVVDLLATGLKNKEIARLMGLTEGTVKIYMVIIFAKTGCETRGEVIAWKFRSANNPEEEDTADIRWLVYYREKLYRPQPKPPRLTAVPIKQGMFSSHFPTHYIPAQAQILHGRRPAQMAEV